MTIRVAIVGFGKIAQDQHVPAMAVDPKFELVGVVSSRGGPAGLPCFPTISELLSGMKGKVDAVAICTPPLVRHAIASEALQAGLCVLLEKPPAATLGEVEDLDRLAREARAGLYAGWHSQHAAGVASAAAALQGKRVTALRISWLEDVRKWHPGQEWIWAAGGFGVFDPGINALSIATAILPEPLFVREARLLYPANKQAPIAATVKFAGEGMQAEMDWRHAEGEQWTISVETEGGELVQLNHGGSRLRIDGAEQIVEDIGEYPSIYRHFAQVVEQRLVEVDREPLRIVADAFLVGSRETVDPFH